MSSTTTQQQGFFSTLFDTSFNSFLMVKIAKIFFILGIVASGIFAVAMLFAGFAEEAPAYFFLAPVVFFAGTLIFRVYAELLIVQFKIAENTKRN